MFWCREEERDGGGGFGARVKCPCCHGDGRPCDPRRRQRGQRTSTAAHGPAVAAATSSLGCSEVLRSQAKEGEERWCRWGPSAVILKKTKKKKKKKRKETGVSFQAYELQALC